MNKNTAEQLVLLEQGRLWKTCSIIKIKKSAENTLVCITFWSISLSFHVHTLTDGSPSLSCRNRGTVGGSSGVNVSVVWGLQMGHYSSTSGRWCTVGNVTVQTNGLIYVLFFCADIYLFIWSTPVIFISDIYIILCLSVTHTVHFSRPCYSLCPPLFH